MAPSLRFAPNAYSTSGRPPWSVPVWQATAATCHAGTVDVGAAATRHVAACQSVTGSAWRWARRHVKRSRNAAPA